MSLKPKLNSFQKRHFLDLRSDNVFKKFFRNSPDLLKSLLQVFLGPDLKITKFGVLDPHFLGRVGEKDSILNLKALINNKININIKTQMENHLGFNEKIMCYSTSSQLQSFKKEGKYKDLKHAYGLVFTNFAVTPESKNKVVSRYQILNEENPHEPLSSHLRFIVANLKAFKRQNKLKSEITDMIDKWYYFLSKSHTWKSIEDGQFLDQEMQKAIKELYKIS